MKATMTVPIFRNGEPCELSLTRAEDGLIEGFVPPVTRLAKASFTVEYGELMAAVAALGAVTPTTFGGGLPDLVDGQLQLIPKAA